MERSEGILVREGDWKKRVTKGVKKSVVSDQRVSLDGVHTSRIAIRATQQVGRKGTMLLLRLPRSRMLSMLSI